ncbi:hypothetical protein [Vibrio metschnikovii]|uniref:hypothetical protein n=1 Tax=Vibrio metschnikovii TaxID=28172 RepID=UPI002FC5EA9F
MAHLFYRVLGGMIARALRFEEEGLGVFLPYTVLGHPFFYLKPQWCVPPLLTFFVNQSEYRVGLIDGFGSAGDVASW